MAATAAPGRSAAALAWALGLALVGPLEVLAAPLPNDVAVAAARAHTAWAAAPPTPTPLAAPRAVASPVCEWAAGRLLVRWSAPAGPPADYFEVQLAGARGAQAFGIYSTAATAAELGGLLPHVVYWVRVRAHTAGAPSLGPGTWGPVGPDAECATGGAAAPSAAPAGEPGRTAAPRPPTRMVEAMRESEFTYDVDYLMNHNSGSILGDAAFLTFSNTPDKPSFLNVTLRNATFTLFCVEVLETHIPGTTTTGGDDTFADYLSCNDNGNATDPQCQCDNYIDRKISGMDPDLNCRTRRGTRCEPETWVKDCVCSCTESSLEQSARFTGMMPTFPNQNQAGSLGVWYSHPKDAECSETEEVGVRRGDGSFCTWKRRPAARVLRGWQVLELGWNASQAREHRAEVDVAQIRHNAAVFHRAIARQPLQPWSCVGEGAETLTAPRHILVV